MREVDLAILGSGPGGYVAAIRAGQLGLRTLLIEKDPVLGGTCLNRGCIPAKALLHAASLYRTMRAASEFGIQAGSPSYEFPKIQQYKNRVVERLNRGVAGLLKKNKVEVRQGFGKIREPGVVQVNGDSIRARFILIATGSVPKTLPGIPVDGKSVLTSDHLWTLSDVPASLLVIGGGAIGVETASTFQAFGTRVTIVELLPRLVPLEDEEISSELRNSFLKQGIGVRLETSVKGISLTQDGVRAELASASGKGETLEVQRVVVAVGRSPATTGIGLENTRIRTDRGYIPVNEWQQTAEPGIYAIGDVCPLPQLAHMASAEGIVAVEHMAGKGPRPVNFDRTPNCTFCHPQVASVGLSESGAKERGRRIRVGKFPAVANSASVLYGETGGFVKIVADEKYGEILGVHILHPHASMMISEAIVAMAAELPADELARVIHPHPTLSEAIPEAAHAVFGSPLHL